MRDIWSNLTSEGWSLFKTLVILLRLSCISGFLKSFATSKRALKSTLSGMGMEWGGLFTLEEVDGRNFGGIDHAPIGSWENKKCWILG